MGKGTRDKELGTREMQMRNALMAWRPNINRKGHKEGTKDTEKYKCEMRLWPNGQIQHTKGSRKDARPQRKCVYGLRPLVLKRCAGQCSGRPVCRPWLNNPLAPISKSVWFTPRKFSRKDARPQRKCVYGLWPLLFEMCAVNWSISIILFWNIFTAVKIDKCHKNHKHYGGDAEPLVKLSFKAVFGSYVCSKLLLFSFVVCLAPQISNSTIVIIICLLLFAFMAFVSLIIVVFAGLSDLKKLRHFFFLHLHHGGFGFHGMFSKSTMGAMFFINRASVFLSFNSATKIRIIGIWTLECRILVLSFLIKT